MTQGGFTRIYLIFNEEDTGFGAGQKPSGHIRIEAREGRAKLNISLQNLQMENQMSCNIWLLARSGNSLKYVHIEKVDILCGKGQLSREFDAKNIKDSGISVDLIDAALITLQYIKGNPEKIFIPLAAFKKEKYNFRDMIDIKNFIISEKVEEIKNIPKVEEEKPIKKVAVEPEVKNDVQDIELKVEEETDNVKEKFNCPDDQIDISKIEIKTENYSPMPPVESMDMFEIPKPSLSSSEYFKRRESVVDMDYVRKEFNDKFEKFKPFESRRRDYKWWKIENPIAFSNILEQANIRTPLLFNPKVLMANYKYKHLITGIYTDIFRKREYLVCGIPAIYKIDDEPFDNMCIWVGREKGKSRYGAFGYWLVYINPKDGKILDNF